MKTNRIKSSKQPITLSVLMCLMLCSPLAMATTTLPSSDSSGGCGDGTAAAISAASQEAGQLAQGVYQQVPQPSNLSTASCFSSILSMGDSIGLSFFNPKSLISSIENMACSAAQNALSWPEQQVNGAINQYGQLPDGLGGVSASSTDNSSGITTNTNNNASGPDVPSLPGLNNKTLSGALG